MVKYIKEEAGEDGWSDWIRPNPSLYKLACCDCCLIHNMQFRVVKGQAEFRVSRNNRSTALMRRHQGIKLK